MRDLFVLELIFFGIACLSSYLTWGPLTSREMVEFFGPKIISRERLSKAAYLRHRQRAGFTSEILRAFLIMSFSLITAPFYITRVSLADVLGSALFRYALGAVILLAASWNLYFGPRTFALKHAGKFKFLSGEHFKKYTRPYWAWLPYPVIVWGGIGLLTFVFIVKNIGLDLREFQSLSSNIHLLAMARIEDLQFASIRLIQFGNWIASASQKYMLTTLLIFIYVIIEQRSSMQSTIFDTSVEQIKIAIWAGLIFTVTFSLVVMPLKYQALLSGIQNQLEALTTTSVPDEHLLDVLNLQRQMEDHDLKWLLVNIVTGYGNLLTFIVAGMILLVWRLYFKDTPLRLVLRLFLPMLVIRALDRFAEGFRIDMDLTQSGDPPTKS